jgi:stage II sporulation protein D
MSTRRTSVRTALIGAVSATVVAALGPATAATTAPARGLPVPDTATITVSGHGYGHGHGLSQYGAEGAARKGLSAQQIVRFYYPHTTAGTLARTVTVWISGDTDQNTTVVARRGLQVRDLAKGTTTNVPTSGRAAKATRWRMTGGGGGETRVAYRTDTWHLWRTLAGDGEFGSTGAHLTLVLADGHQVTYRGALRSVGPIKDHPRRITVNRVSLEGYVQGVVPREMPASWHQAALRAQAIAARTYAAYGLDSPLSSRAALCDTTACQVYGGLTAEDPRSNQAVAATKGMVREYQGAPAFTQFSASNGGWTSAGSTPYLDAHQDPYDGWAGNPVHTWSTKVTSRQVERHWTALGNLQSITIDQRDGNGQWNGRVEKMTLHGSKADRHISGDDFRLRLGLRSTWFNLTIG